MTLERKRLEETEDELDTKLFIRFLDLQLPEIYCKKLKNKKWALKKKKEVSTLS